MIDYVNVKRHSKAELWLKRNLQGIKAGILLALVIMCGGIDGWM